MWPIHAYNVHIYDILYIIWYGGNVKLKAFIVSSSAIEAKQSWFKRARRRMAWRYVRELYECGFVRAQDMFYVSYSHCQTMKAKQLNAISLDYRVFVYICERGLIECMWMWTMSATKSVRRMLYLVVALTPVVVVVARHSGDIYIEFEGSIYVAAIIHKSAIAFNILCIYACVPIYSIAFNFLFLYNYV